MKEQTQLTLTGGKVEIETFHKLSENNLKILEVFVNNPYNKLNQSALATYFIGQQIMSRVTLLRFLVDATKWGYIKEMKPTIISISKQGYRTVKKAIFDDKSEAPSLDARKKYYQITEKGIEIYNKNVGRN